MSWLRARPFEDAPDRGPSFTLMVVFFSLLSCRTLAHDEPIDEIRRLTDQMQTQTQNAELFLRRGDLYRISGRHEQAYTDYDRVLQLDPNLWKVHLSRGLLFLDWGKPERAREALDLYLSMDPDNTSARIARARAFVRTANASSALEDYDQALKAKPNPDIYLERARLQRSIQRIDEALQGLDEATQQLGPLVTLELYAIDLELERKRYDSALERLTAVSKQAERKEMWWTRRGEIQEMAGRAEEARNSYLQALAALEKLPEGRKNTSTMLALRRKVEAALDRLNAPEGGQ